MAVYDSKIALALRLLEKFGQSVTWRTLVDGAASDPAKPWKPSDGTIVDTPVNVAFLPRKRENQKSAQYMKESEVPKGSVLGYMGQVGFKPKLKDVIIRGSKQYVVETIDVVEPNDEGVILYTMELSAPNAVSEHSEPNQVWVDELDNIVAVFDPANDPAVDAGYPCFEGSYIKAKKAGLTYAIANNPTFRYQCDDGESIYPPEAIADLSGIPLADWNFSDCDSVVVNDFNWLQRNYFTFGALGSIVGGLYQIAASGITQCGAGIALALPQGSVKQNFQRLTTSDFAHNVGFSFAIGSAVYGVYAFAYGGGSYFQTITRDGVPQWFGGMFATTPTEGEITWDGANVRCFVGGIERFSEANAGGTTLLGPIFLADLNTSFGPGGSVTADFGPYEIRDAAVGGNLLYADIAGVSC